MSTKPTGPRDHHARQKQPPRQQPVLGALHEVFQLARDWVLLRRPSVAEQAPNCSCREQRLWTGSKHCTTPTSLLFLIV